MTHLDPTEITDHHRVLRRPDHLLHLSLEVVYLMQDGRFGWALANMLLNLAGSLAMTLLAFMLVMWVNGR